MKWVIFLLLLAPSVYGTTTFEGATGASNVEDDDSVIEIFGGLAGDSTSCDINTDGQTCNNCPYVNGNSLTACNPRRITSTSEVTINISSDNAETSGGEVILVKDDSQISISDTSRTTSYTVGNTASITIPWDTICDYIVDDPANCVDAVAESDSVTASFDIGFATSGESSFISSESVSITFKVSTVDTDEITATDCSDSSNTPGNEGVCDFSVYPGDEKVFILDTKIPDTSYPNTGKSSIDFKYVRVYFSDSSFADAVPKGLDDVDCNNDKNCKQFTMENIETDSPTLSSNIVDNLENGTKYYFRLANVDEAMNIFRFTSTSVLSTNEDRFATTPSEVLGALDGQECFIATAAYGSPLNEELHHLRWFRDNYLLTHSVGRWFVNYYYQTSPPWAHWLTKHEGVRIMTRASLTPVVWMISFMRTSPLLFALIWAGVAFLFFYSYRRRKRVHV